MRLTKVDGAVLLGAIDAELESQRYRQLRRGEYLPLLSTDVEKSLQAEDAARSEVLRKVRDKIKRQL